MKRSDVTIVGARTFAELDAAAAYAPFQLITGDGASAILLDMTDAQAEFCFANCVFAHSFGPDGAEAENLIDGFSERLELYKGDRFFPTVSGATWNDLIWIIISQSYETPRLIALSTRDDFRQQVQSWFERADTELVEEPT